ncbi:cytochrome P450 [Mycena albidolilacea]|uniref:Cytochrome P450 n=1 Tax=Mycena albidolilacea TaxID=1033008 RepID=A0AAD6ZFU7_9AGAR|nr:cytochrome P450 [Mycena albidolilacea]
MLSESLSIAVLTLTAAILGCRLYRNRNLPPRPPGHWLLGHTFEIPSRRPWRKFDEWGKTNGPIYSLAIARTPVVILTGFHVTHDLLNKRLATFSTRPPRVMASLFVCGFDKALTFLPPGKHFKKTRRYLQETLNVRAAQAHESMQEAEVRAYALRLLEGSNVQDESRMLYSSVLLQLSLGYKPEELSDPIITLSERVAKSAALILSPGRFWVELLPLSKHLPSALLGFHVNRSVRAFNADLKQLIAESSRVIRSTMDDLQAPPSFCSKILKNVKSEDYTETKALVDFASISMYAGAVDTTIASLDTFLVAMMLYPDTQLRAQTEIDSVLGSGRLPTHADRSSLPYVEAILIEILRWNPPIPMTSRRLTSDVAYGDFLLPRGCNVIANIWQVFPLLSMNHDEDVFHDPEEFLPERFLGPKGNESVRRVQQATFGFGTRVCPGQHFATSSLWITIATLLTIFTVHPVPGEENKPVLDCEEGALIRILPYKCDLKPRSQMVVDALKRSQISMAAR